MLTRVGKIEAQPGQDAFGYLKAAKSRSGVSLDIQVHIFDGAEYGPTLLVQVDGYGAEVIGTMAILNFVKQIDVKKIRGNVILVPVVNRKGFAL